MSSQTFTELLVSLRPVKPEQKLNIDETVFLSAV